MGAAPAPAVPRKKRRAYPRGQILTAVALHERRNLSRETQLWIERIERQYVESWVGVLGQLRPELADDEGRMMVRGVQGMSLTVALYRSGIAPERLAELLGHMVRSA